MSRVNFDGKWKVYWASTVSDMTAPTTAEISGATDITSFCPKDFLTLGEQQGRVDAGDISTIFGKEGMGTWRMQTSGMFFKDDTSDDAWDLWSHGTAGYMVILWHATASSPASGDEAYVFHLETGEPIPTSPAENERQKFNLPFAHLSDPELDAAVA